MKRSTKTLLRFMVFFLVIGGALCIAGLSMGFRPATLYAMEESGELKWVGPTGWRKVAKRTLTGGDGTSAQAGAGAGGNGNGAQAGAGAGGNGNGVQAGAGAGGNGNGVQAGVGADTDGTDAQAGAGEGGNGTDARASGGTAAGLSEEDAEYRQTFTGVKNLDLECGVTDCVLIPWDGEEWKVLGNSLPSGFLAEKEGDTLEIECAHRHLFGAWNGEDTSYLEIYIPRDQVLEELDLSVGVGSLTMGEGIIRCRDLDLECGVGSCSLRLDIQKEADLDCGVGDVELELQGAERDFDYDLDLGLGDVIIGESSYGGFADDRRINNGASKEIAMDCGVGSVTVRFFEPEE